MRRHRVAMLAASLATVTIGACTAFSSARLESSGADDGGFVDTSRGDETAVDADGGAGCDGANLATDPQHCGRCGHDCLGGGCADGMCQPITIAQYADTLGADAPLAATATHVLWTEPQNKVQICLKTGCSAATAHTVIAKNKVTSLAADPSSGFAIWSGDVQRIETNGEGPVPIGDFTSPAQLHAREGAVFVLETSNADGGVYRIPKDGGGAPTRLSYDTTTSLFGVAGGLGILGRGGSPGDPLDLCPLNAGCVDGSTLETVPVYRPNEPGGDDTRVIWIAGTTADRHVEGCDPTTGCGSVQTLLRIDAGVVHTTLARPQLYVATDDHTVGVCAIDDCGTTWRVLARDVEVVSTLVVDDSSILWIAREIEDGGAIYRVTRLAR